MRYAYITYMHQRNGGGETKQPARFRLTLQKQIFQDFLYCFFFIKNSSFKIIFPIAAQVYVWFYNKLLVHSCKLVEADSRSRCLRDGPHLSVSSSLIPRQACFTMQHQRSQVVIATIMMIRRPTQRTGRPGWFYQGAQSLHWPASSQTRLTCSG